MPSVDERTRFRFTYFFLGLSILAVMGSYLFALWITSRQEKALQPRPAVEQIIKALRSYHHQTGRFPQSFVELRTRVWRQGQPANFGEDGRSFSIANYYYLYYSVDPGTCTLWAIPINKRREEGSTFFLTLSPKTARRWKGAALALDEIKRLPGVPDPAQLALLGLIEQEPLNLQPPRNDRKASINRN